MGRHHPLGQAATTREQGPPRRVPPASGAAGGRRVAGTGWEGARVTAAYYQRDNIALYHGQFQDVMASLPEASVEAVIADPPYPKEYLPLWGPLAEHSARVLVRGGSLLSIVPHYALPSILATVGVNLKYRWTLCMRQSSGAHPRMAMGIEICWKPIVWWVKDAWPSGRGFKADAFDSVDPGRDKIHRWQQSLEWARYCLRFVPDGGLVVDPLMGSGTLPLVCLEQGRPCIGIDSDEASCQIAAQRLETAS